MLVTQLFFDQVMCISVKKGNKALLGVVFGAWTLEFNLSTQRSLFWSLCSVIFLLLSSVCCEHSPVQVNNARGLEDRPSLLPHDGQGNYHLTYQFSIKSLFSWPCGSKDDILFPILGLRWPHFSYKSLSAHRCERDQEKRDLSFWVDRVSIDEIHKKRN